LSPIFVDYGRHASLVKNIGSRLAAVEAKAGLWMAFLSLSPSNLPTIFQERLHFAVIKTGCATEKWCAQRQGGQRDTLVM